MSELPESLWNKGFWGPAVSVLGAGIEVMNHPLLSSLTAIDAALDEVAGMDPIYLSTAEK